MLNYKAEHKKIEQKWQNFWQTNNSFKTLENSSKPKYYVLEMFPYPSGNLHMGHLRNYSIGDVVARYKKAQGYNVLHPMGWDAFGLPAENAAIENKVHPGEWTKKNIANMKKQFQPIGLSYDWSREISTCEPDYYKHEQAMFIDFYKNGLAYQKESVVNWDPVDNTVLANEQVVDGRGWRSGALVEKKKLKQWFLKITDFSNELLEEVKKLDGWPEKVRLMQENWIGKSYGASVHFKVAGSDDHIEIFTTRPDTLFGASFVALSPNHPLVATIENDEIREFIASCDNQGLTEEQIETAEKRGVKTTLEVEHPFDASIKLPVYIANFVIMEYGTGAIFACPAHDERDHEFATKYNLPITQVVKPMDGADVDVRKKAFTDDQNGILINSEFLNGLTPDDAKKVAIEKLESVSAGKAVEQFRLRDWGVSRQRYWGCPIPIIYCESCGVLPVPKEQLPVTLPEDVDFSKPGNPLDRHPTWKNVKCHECGKDAKRETDTFDTFFESSWYFARFCSPNAENGFTKDEANHWLPVDQYIGGIEHAVLHLLYARFFTKALKKCGYLDIDEPFKALLTQGMVLHKSFKSQDDKWVFPNDVEFKEGKAFHKVTKEEVRIGRLEKMSKSKKNVVDPMGIIDEYSADTARLLLLSDSPPERDLEWTSSGVEGAFKYLSKLYDFIANLTDNGKKGDDEKTLNKIHSTIKNVTDDLDRFHLNRAIARIRELTNYLEKNMQTIPYSVLIDGIRVALRLLNPFTPHITEELWNKINGDEQKTLVDNDWPKADEKYLQQSNVVIAVQVNGKMRGTIEMPIDSAQKNVEDSAKQLNNVKEQLLGKEIVKVIYVPSKIINLICK